uniref:Uncharacterized protein n=1 Tax=Amphimedon queenslandica TaxID=400682 RepID=A0A1X7T6Y6_AMPQE
MTEGHRLWTAERPFSPPQRDWGRRDLAPLPLTFGAAKVNYQGSGELMAYGQIILNLAHEHGGWHTTLTSVSSEGRPQPPMNGAEFVNAHCKCSPGGWSVCWLCQSHDHHKKDCALAPPPLQQIDAPAHTN